MNISQHPFWLILTLLAVSCPAAVAQTTDSPGPGFLPLGKIKPRSAKEIASSTWSIGGETLDRDFGVYANYQKYLGPLGAKGIRLQTGWAKCERTPGIYDFAWLDEVVNDSLAQGVQPWLQVSYGNKLYPDGGGTGLGGSLPKSPLALTAWDNWVRAVVKRYQDRVSEWEVWNEPDLGPSPAEEYAEFFIRTAEIIRAEQPRSRIFALALAHKVAYAEAFLARIHQRDKLALIDAITVHSYPNNPDDTRNIDEMRAIIASHGGAPIAVRQGETGATSKFQENFALKKLPMTETIQAKWNLRRMLAHHGKDVPFNLFTMIDLHYRWNGKVDMNYKGLLASREDQTVAYAKPAYFAAQNVFAIFDDSLARVTNFGCAASVTNAVAAFAYTNKTGDRAITLWFKGAMPSDSNAKTLVDFTLHESRFTTPVYADLRTGEVYSMPKANWSRIGAGIVFRQIPVYDSPILIAEKTVLKTTAAQ